MFTFHSFLQCVYHLVKNMTVRVTKQMHRNTVVSSTGLVVLTVVALTSTGFGGSGKFVLTAFTETWSETESGTDEDVEEIEDLTEAEIQVNLTDSRWQGQLVVGELLAREIQQKQESQLTAQAEIGNVRKEILKEAETKALVEAEEATKKAEEEARKASAVAPYIEQDYQALLRIVQAKAGICDDKGKILVANVILNRVKNREFPSNITDVVYQKSQFSPVSGDSINTVKISGQTMDCVNRALAGEDYSDGALHFMYRGGSRASVVNWFNGRLTFLLQHERHEFFK